MKGVTTLKGHKNKEIGKELEMEKKRETIREVEDGERETNPVENNSDDLTAEQENEVLHETREREYKEQEELKKKEEKEKKPTPMTGLYFGYKIVEDNNVKELRLPNAVIKLLRTATQGFDYSKEDIIPGKYWVCTKDGFKMNAIKGKTAGMFYCPKKGCGKQLHQT